MTTAFWPFTDLVAAAEKTAGEQGSIGIGIPGSPNPRTGIVRNSNAVLINGKPLGRDLEQALGRKVRLANDANCLAVSEAVDGAGKDAQTVFGVIVGTGHGGGLAIGKKVHAGYQGVAAEIGHYPLPWMTKDEYPGHKCWCGKHGCLDMYACGTGVELDYRLTTGVEKRGRDIIAGEAGRRSGVNRRLRSFRRPAGAQPCAFDQHRRPGCLRARRGHVECRRDL